MRSIVTLAALALITTLGACKPSSPQASAPISKDSPAWLLTSTPGDAVEVSQVKASAKEGDEVVLRGRIGGRKDPMSTDTALFVLMDTSVPSCKDMEGETCTTPWDYCCEAPETLAANNATVQLVGDDGSVMKLDLAKYGFEPLDEVIVVGTVGPRPSEQVLTVRASGIHRVGS